MKNDIIKKNASDLDAELNWLAEIIETRIRLKNGQKNRYRDISRIKPPSLKRSNSMYARFVRDNDLGVEERFLLILSMVPYLRPPLLDALTIPELTQPEKTIAADVATRHSDSGPADPGLAQHGPTDPGVTASYPTDPGLAAPTLHSGFIPTGETAMFIYAGDDLEKRLALLKVLDSTHPLSRMGVLRLGDVPSGEPMLRGALLLSDAVLQRCTTGESAKAVNLTGIPSTLLSTNLDWNDLVLADQVLSQLQQVEMYLRNRKILSDKWRGEKHLRPGLNVLFHGPPGTGKTLAAALLSKKTGVDVYRIDLSAVVSAYIGETEKNLSRIFERAANRDIVLFFDEADALFGKHSSFHDARDLPARHAASSLAQFMEHHEGLVILAVDSKNKLGDAFLEKFQLSVHFPLPGPDQRLRLWKEGFGKSETLHRDVDLKKIAAEYELSGAAIMNVIRFASLHALRRKSSKVAFVDILEGMLHHKSN